MTLAELCLSTRSLTCLSNARIETIEALRNTSSETLLSMRNFGQSGLQEIYAALYAVGTPHIEDDLPFSRDWIDRAIGGLRERINQLESFKIKIGEMEEFRENFKKKRDGLLSRMNQKTN